MQEEKPTHLLLASNTGLDFLSLERGNHRVVI